jgi:hypothetical protein
VRVSLVLMAHPKRWAFVEELKEKLHDPYVVWDDGSNDRWSTGRRAMLSYNEEATHQLVIQDDALVCSDLVAGLERALEHVPEGSPVCLYVGRVRPSYERMKVAAKECARVKASWLVMDGINWGVGVCVPTSCIEEMVQESDKVQVSNYDSRMSGYFTRRNIPVYYTWPSLVDHRDSPSLVEGRGGKRHAFWFVGEDQSALSVDWSGAVVDFKAPNGMVTFRSKNGKYASFAEGSAAARRYRRKSYWIEQEN